MGGQTGLNLAKTLSEVRVPCVCCSAALRHMVPVAGRPCPKAPLKRDDRPKGKLVWDSAACRHLYTYQGKHGKAAAGSSAVGGAPFGQQH